MEMFDRREIDGNACEKNEWRVYFLEIRPFFFLSWCLSCLSEFIALSQALFIGIGNGLNNLTTLS